MSTKKKRIQCKHKHFGNELDCPHNHPHWKHTPDRHDFESAENYLTLIMSTPDAKSYRKKLWEQRFQLVHHPAKDILRASMLPLLPEDNVHVVADLRTVEEDDGYLSPILLIRGNYQRPLYIADGYHRVCASYYIDENTRIPAILL